MKYLEPEMVIIEFGIEDVIRTSATSNTGEVKPDITWPTN